MKKNPTHHVFVCTGKKADGQEGNCHARGSQELAVRLRELAGKRGLAESVRVNECDCFRCGISTRGPNLVVYPEGVWYGGVSLADLGELIESHFKHGKIVERLVLAPTRPSAGASASLTHRSPFAVPPGTLTHIDSYLP
jgi:(2Fe-2S) ferredoxin